MFSCVDLASFDSIIVRLSVWAIDNAFHKAIILDVQVFSVIPAKAGILKVSDGSGIALKLHFVPAAPLCCARNDNYCKALSQKKYVDDLKSLMVEKFAIVKTPRIKCAKKNQSLKTIIINPLPKEAS